MAKKYTVDMKAQKVYAQIAKLSGKDLKEVKNFIELKFELVNVEPPKLSKEEKAKKAKENKEKKEIASKENPYSKENVEKFLNKEENKKLLEEYKARYNEQAGTNRKVKKADGSYEELPDEPKFLNSGKPKVKGYANCIGWFTKKFKWNEETKKYEAIE